MGFIHVGGSSHDGGGLKKGVAITGQLIVVYIHRCQHGFRFFASARRIIVIVFIVVVAGGIISPEIRMGLYLCRHLIGSVSGIVAIAVTIVTFYHVDI